MNEKLNKKSTNKSIVQLVQKLITMVRMGYVNHGGIFKISARNYTLLCCKSIVNCSRQPIKRCQIISIVKICKTVLLFLKYFTSLLCYTSDLKRMVVHVTTAALKFETFQFRTNATNIWHWNLKLKQIIVIIIDILPTHDLI